MTRKYQTKAQKRIKQVATEIFLQKGYNGSRTREITEKAGVNLALLNYYFGGKEQLFKIIVAETLEEFKNNMRNILNNPKTSFEEKISEFFDYYINIFMKSPRLLVFIMDEIKKDMNISTGKTKLPQHSIVKTTFSKQYTKKTGKTADEFKKFFINLLGRVAFPIIGAPIFTNSLEVPKSEYLEFLKERKEIIFKILPDII